MATTEKRVIGQDVTRVDGIDRVTGQARYAADLSLPGTLYCRLLRSPHAHARIRGIDTSRARAHPGVKAVVTGADWPSLESGSAGGDVTPDIFYLRQFFLAEDRALFHGHPVAAVAAVNAHAAEEALALIEVDYETLPAVLDILEAMEPEAPIVHPNLRTRGFEEAGTTPTNVSMHMAVARGDMERGFAEADVTLDREYKVGMVHQGYIEPQACSVSVSPSGQTTVYTTTQGVFRIKQQVATILDLPQNLVTAVPLEIGGGFGGKAFNMIELPTALLAMKTGRPVKTVLSRDEVFRATGPAPDVSMRIKLGAKTNGEVTACEAQFYVNAGCVPGNALPVTNILVAGLSPYRFPNLDADGYDIITNKVRTSAYRAPGLPSGAFGIEVAMDELADELGMDPFDLRIVNAAQDGEPMTDGFPLPTTNLAEILRDVKAHPAWSSTVPEGRGRGMAIGFRREGGGTSSAQITLNADATFSLVTGSVDITGTRTSLAQIAAELLGVGVREVSSSMGDTDAVGYTDSTVGSRTTYVTGMAVSNAVEDLLRQLKARAAEGFQVDASEVEYGDRSFFVRDNPEQHTDLSEIAKANTGRGAGAVMGQGVASALRQVTSTGVHVVEVEVDPDTGRAHVARYTPFQDPGHAVNPMAVEGQMQGGAAQGIGWALWEEYRWSDGKMGNATFLDYQMPTALDVPMIETVFVGLPAPENPLGIRGTGEVPIVPPLAAIANAVKNLTGKRLREIPLSPETIFRAMHE